MGSHCWIVGYIGSPETVKQDVDKIYVAYAIQQQAYIFSITSRKVSFQTSNFLFVVRRYQNCCGKTCSLLQEKLPSIMLKMPFKWAQQVLTTVLDIPNSPQFFSSLKLLLRIDVCCIDPPIFVPTTCSSKKGNRRINSIMPETTSQHYPTVPAWNKRTSNHKICFA